MVNNTIIENLIEKSYNKNNVSKYINFKPSNIQVKKIAEIGKDILLNFPDEPGACALMSAIWSTIIMKETELPILVVAGSLCIDNSFIFGQNLTLENTKNIFHGKNLDWDGHCWVLFGNVICDISIFRTAYSEHSPTLLKKGILSKFGGNRGLLIATIDSLIQSGIEYMPKYILTNDQIQGLSNSAFAIIENKSKNL